MFSPIETYQQQIIDEVSPTLTYVGFTKVGALVSEAKWQIQKIETIGSITTISLPLINGEASANFFFVWNNRASYTYSL